MDVINSKKVLRLQSLKSTIIKIGDVTLSVPLFLVDAFNIIRSCIETEGLFRKSCNAVRVKNLKYPFHGEYGLPEGLNVSDVCYLIKQFFREIQEPLLTDALEPHFLKFHLMQHETVRVRYVLELCHVLSPPHREILAFLMRKLRQVSFFAESNKMDIQNLATVFWPSIFRSRCSKQDLIRYLNENLSHDSNQMFYEKKDIEIKCALLKILIENAEKIAVLSDYEKVMSPDMYDFLLPEDKLTNNGNNTILWRLSKKEKACGREVKSFQQKHVITPVVQARKKQVIQKRLSLIALDSSNEAVSAKSKAARVSKDVDKKDAISGVILDENLTAKVEETVKNGANQISKTENVELEEINVGENTKTEAVEKKKGDLIPRCASGKSAKTEPLDNVATPRSKSDSSFYNSPRFSVYDKSHPAVSKKNRLSPRKKLRRNTGRIMSKNRPSGFTASDNLMPPEDVLSDENEEYVFKIPVLAPKPDFLVPSVPVQSEPAPDFVPRCDVTQNSMDFENSEARKQMLISLNENPVESPAMMLQMRRNPKILLNSCQTAAAGRPSVAYILKTRKGLVRENKALFEGIAKNWHSGLVSTSPMPPTYNLQQLSLDTNLATPKIIEESETCVETVAATKFLTPNRRLSRLSTSGAKNSAPKSNSAKRHQLKRITGPSSANRQLKKKYPASPKNPLTTRAAKMQLMSLLDMQV